MNKFLCFLLLLSSQLFCQQEWTYSEPTHDGEMSIEMIQISDGSYLSITSVSTDSCRYIGGLRKFNALGQLLWSKEYANPESQTNQLYFRQIIETPNCIFIRAGSEFSTHGNILMKLDKEGNVIQNFVLTQEVMNMAYYQEEDLLYIEHLVDLDLTNKGSAFALYSLDLQLNIFKTAYQLGLPALLDKAKINSDKSISTWRAEGERWFFKTVTFDGDVLVEAEVTGDENPLYGELDAIQLSEKRWLIAPGGLFQQSEENLSLFTIDTENAETKYHFMFGNSTLTHVTDLWSIGTYIVVSIGGNNNQGEYFYVFNQQLQLINQFNLYNHLLENTEDEHDFLISRVNLNDKGELLTAGAPYILSEMNGDIVPGGYLNAVYPLFNKLGLSISNTTNPLPITFTIYPNPTRSFITITLDKIFIGGNYSITDMQGRKVHQSIIESESITHDLNQLLKGKYIINLAKDDIQKSNVLVIN